MKSLPVAYRMVGQSISMFGCMWISNSLEVNLVRCLKIFSNNDYVDNDMCYFIFQFGQSGSKQRQPHLNGLSRDSLETNI